MAQLFGVRSKKVSGVRCQVSGTCSNSREVGRASEPAGFSSDVQPDT